MSKFIRKDLKNFKPYTASKTLEQIGKETGILMEKIIKLDSSENPFMESLQNKAKVRNIDFYLYPDSLCLKLRGKLGKYAGVRTEQIVCGNGSDELIDLIIRSFVNKDEEIIICPPTFVMYEFYAKLSGVKIKMVIRKEDFKIDLSKILKSITTKTKLIIIDSPGNPTGDITPLSVLEKILKKGCLVISDEAYFEYCGKTAIPLLKKYPNLIILRSLSKWSGLAGLRIGYAIASEEIINIILSLKPPYNVSSLTQSLSENFLNNSKIALQRMKKITEGRDYLNKKLSDIKELEVYKNNGAYILIKLKKDPEKLLEYLTKNGVLVKLLNQPLLENCIRMSLPLPNQINQIYSTFKDFYKNYIDGIIFDMDGVLIDVSNSYRLAIEKTVNYFLDGQKTNQEEVSEIKKISGFNDDWDTSYALRKLKERKIPKNKFTQFVNLLSKKDRRTKLYKNIKDVFQTFYVGSGEFEKIEGKSAPFTYNNPLRFAELSLIKKGLLKRLSRKYKLGIVTGRLRNEAIFALKQFEMQKYFSSAFIITSEDTAKKKPAPDPLLKAMKEMKSSNPIYIGDSINDFECAKSANVPFVYIGDEKIGEYQLSDINDLSGGIINV